jgi:hypothetical protein
MPHAKEIVPHAILGNRAINSPTITHEARRSFNVTMKRLLPTMVTNSSKSCKKQCERNECLSAGWEIFLASAVTTHFNLYGAFLLSLKE